MNELLHGGFLECFHSLLFNGWEVYLQNVNSMYR